MQAGIDDAVLHALGLSECQLGEQETVPWLDPAVGQARGIATRELSSAALATLRVVPISAGLLGSMGLSGFAAADSSGLVKLVGSGDVSIRLVQAGHGRTFQSEAEPKVAWVDATRSGPFLVETSTGRLICSLDQSQLHLRAVLEPVNFAPLASIEEAAGGWMRSSGDGWIRAEAVRALEASGPWSVCVAAGLHARLVDPAAFGPPGESVDALLKGVSPEWLSRPRQWVRALSPLQVSTMRRLALAEVDRLSELADRLGRTESAKDEWREEWRRLCHGRDALEGVRVLLAEVEASAELDAHLKPLDHAGALLNAEAPLARLRPDERLRRARLANPDAWWGWLA